MLTIEIELLHGTFRGSSQDIALTGADDPGEWPPSPGRLFSALVAGDGTRERCSVTDGSELRFLECQPPPVIHADPPAQVPASVLRERFVVLNDTAKQTTQNYPARMNNVARPGTRHSPQRPWVAYVWPEAEPDPAVVEGLQRRAARVGYLGCADSPVRVRISTVEPGPSVPADQWQPDPAGTTQLSVPFDGMVDVLDTIYDDFRSQTVRRSWYRIESEPYRPPGAADPTFQVGGTGVWLVFERSLPGRRVLAVTTTLREAIFDLYQREVGAGEELPPVLTGHGFEGRGYQHAHWLALPDVGHDHASGRLHGAAVWLPPTAGTDVVAGVRAAARRLRDLVRPGVFETTIAASGDHSPQAATARRWQRSSKRFVSVFPVVHERFVRPRPRDEDVAEWCQHAGLPAPSNFTFHRLPVTPGTQVLASTEVFRPGEERRPFAHMVLEFPTPVIGPVVLGRKRQFGLGLFLPQPLPRNKAESSDD